MSTGIDLITAERARQVGEEGYTAERDEGRYAELMGAARAYEVAAIRRVHQPEGFASFAHPMDYESALIYGWPWAEEYWKPTGDPIRDLTKAGALIAAAIDSLSTNRTIGGQA